MLAAPAAADRMPAGFHRLIAAQFVSALADNALLIVTMALLQQRGAPAWWAPLLKFGFTLSYVFLAPVVGPLADAFPKARLMAWMNGVKVLGVLGLIAGANPIAASVISAREGRPFLASVSSTCVAHTTGMCAASQAQRISSCTSASR